MAEAKLQASGRGWTQADLTEAHKALMAALGNLERARVLARGLLDPDLVELRMLLENADALLYAADQDAGRKAKEATLEGRV